VLLTRHRTLGAAFAKTLYSFGRMSAPDVDYEGAFEAGDIEGPGREGGVRMRQRGTRMPRNLQRARSRANAATMTFEQGIVGEFAQPRQRLTHRRLRDAEPLGRAGEVALADDRVEYRNERQQFPIGHARHFFTRCARIPSRRAASCTVIAD
jgi:hypothetical protein